MTVAIVQFEMTLTRQVYLFVVLFQCLSGQYVRHFLFPEFEMSEPIDPSCLSDLIGGIYDCTIDPTLWEPTLHRIKEALGGQAAYLRLDDLSSRSTIITKSAGIDPVWLERQPSLAPEVADILVGVLASGHSMDLPSVASRHLSRAEIDATRYHREWGRPQGLFDYMGLFLMQSPTRLASLEVARHEDAGIFTGREARLGELLVPHLRRAVTISNALDAATIERTRMAETLDMLRLGVVLADEESRVLHANRAAETMMRSGGPVRYGDGRLQAANAAASAEIKAAIGIAARNESEIGKTGLSVRLSSDSKAPVVAHVLPLAKGDIRTRLDPTAVAAVFINSNGEDENKILATSAAFSLTPAETRVLHRVLSGRNVSEAAHDLGVAASTVRTHLDNIFLKTGVSRQGELVRLVARMMPVAL